MAFALRFPCCPSKSTKYKCDEEILRLESGASLFTSSAADAFTVSALPVSEGALSTLEDEVLVVVNSCVENKSYTLKYIPEESTVLTSNDPEALSPRETLEKVKAVLRFLVHGVGVKTVGF